MRITSKIISTLSISGIVLLIFWMIGTAGDMGIGKITDAQGLMRGVVALIGIIISEKGISTAADLKERKRSKRTFYNVVIEKEL